MYQSNAYGIHWYVSSVKLFFFSLLADSLAAAQCVNAAQILNLPNLGPGVTVCAHHQQLADFLGCAMLF